MRRSACASHRRLRSAAHMPPDRSFGFAKLCGALIALLLVLTACGVEGGYWGTLTRCPEFGRDYGYRLGGDAPAPTAPTDVVDIDGIPKESSRLNKTSVEGLRGLGAYRDLHRNHFAGEFGAGDAGWYWVGFTEDAEGHLAELRKRVAEPDLLRVFRARYTWDELRQLQGRIGDDWQRLEREGIDINSTGVQPRINKLAIGLLRLEPSWMRTLSSRYGGDRLCFEQADVLIPVAALEGLGTASGTYR